MSTEAQLKAQMQAAIAKKKQSDASHHSQVTPKAAKSPSAASKTDTKTESTSTTKPLTPSSPQPQAVPAVDKSLRDIAVPSEAEWTRSFFGRPVRIAVYQKEIYYAVPDVLGITTTTATLTKYDELLSDSSTQKLISPLVRAILFPSPNGGHEKLDAAKAEDLITVINKLELQFPGSIEKWLVETSTSLMDLIS